MEETDAVVNNNGNTSTGKRLTDVPDTEFNGGGNSDLVLIITPIVVGVILLIVVIVAVVTARKGKCCDCFIKTFPKLFKPKSPEKEDRNLEFDSISQTPNRRRTSDKKKSMGQDNNEGLTFDPHLLLDTNLTPIGKCAF